MSQLSTELIRQVWPAERVVIGLRVSKDIRKDLIVNETPLCAILKFKQHFNSHGAEIARDVERLSHMKIRIIAQAQNVSVLNQLWGALGKCKALSFLSVSQNRMGDEGAARLAGALGACNALSHLDVSHNRMGAEGAGRLAEALGALKELSYLNITLH